MINYNNHNINKISYNNHSIKYVYGCGGNLVWSDIPTGGTKFIAVGPDEPYTYELQCNGNPTLTSNETHFSYSFTPHVTDVTIGDCVTSIGDNAFNTYNALSGVTFGNYITSIGQGAFAMTKLISVTIPSGVTSMGYGAFQACNSLTSVTFQNSVIGYAAFSQCTSLTSVIIGNGVTSIGSGAFESCSGLTSIDIPSSVTVIDGQAFRNCSSLTSVTVRAITPPRLGYNAFDNTNNCPLYVPSASLNAYKAASVWKTYSDRIFPF